MQRGCLVPRARQMRIPARDRLEVEEEVMEEEEEVEEVEAH
jgi:hypothetical protein